MNIASTLFRVVGRHGEARTDDVWHSLGRVMDDRQMHRHGDSRFLYPPSCRHVHFNPSPSQDHEHVEPVCEHASIVESKLRYR